MLDSLPKLAEFLLSNALDLLPSITTAPTMGAGTARVTPQDPSTLALAVAGFVTLAMYLAATGWRKPRRDVRRMSRPAIKAESPRPSTTAADTPRRGAA
jgi:hypothetical protein